MFIGCSCSTIHDTGKLRWYVQSCPCSPTPHRLSSSTTQRRPFAPFRVFFNLPQQPIRSALDRGGSSERHISVFASASDLGALTVRGLTIWEEEWGVHRARSCLMRDCFAFLRFILSGSLYKNCHISAAAAQAAALWPHSDHQYRYRRQIKSI